MGKPDEFKVVCILPVGKPDEETHKIAAPERFETLRGKTYIWVFVLSLRGRRMYDSYFAVTDARSSAVTVVHSPFT